MSRNQPLTIFNLKIADNVSTGASFETSSQDVRETTMYTMHYIWTGTTDGYTRIQCSNDNVNWVSISGASLKIDNSHTTGAINVADPAYQYVRAIFERTSGTGTMNIYFSGKRV